MLEFQKDTKNKPPQYTSNIRFQLAKQKIEQLFLKFLSFNSTKEMVNQLVNDIKGNKLNTSQIPHPLFTNTKMSLQNSILGNQSMKSPQKNPSTPPKNSPKVDRMRESFPSSRDHSIDGFSQLSQQNNKSDVFSNKSSESSFNQRQDLEKVLKEQKQQQEIEQQQKLQQKEQEIQQQQNSNINYDIIPVFYDQKQIQQDKKEKLQAQMNKINEIFEFNEKKKPNSKSLDVNDFHKITIEVLELPEFLSELIFNKIDTQQKGKITRDQFVKYFNEWFANNTPKKNCFNIFKKHQNNYIEFDDFRPMMNILLQNHPGLEFLQNTPEFQDRYAETVIFRIFFMLSRRDDGQIKWRDFNISNFFDTLYQLDKEEDINKVRNFFSYEHFYVLYCKFWELDQDHDFLINKDEFSRYQGHCLSKKTVDRIFEGKGRKLKGGDGLMNYEDFIYFVLVEEDKTTLTSIEYWFKIIDLDDNGIITGYEMEYFYEEQRQRLEYLNHEIVYFEDVVCQMVDLLKPEDDIKFYLSHFKEEQQQCGVFFNMLTNLNKFVSYEQRDPFVIKHELTEHPDYTDWDRFAANEYLRLAMEEEQNENPEIDANDPWDGDEQNYDNNNQQQQQQQMGGGGSISPR